MTSLCFWCLPPSNGLEDFPSLLAIVPLKYFLSGARSALPMGVALEAMFGYLLPNIGSRPCILPNFLELHNELVNIYFLRTFAVYSIGCANSAPDGSSPRVYVRVLVAEHRLKLL